ncbi:peptidylprolyl isomerase [Streptomyces sp. RKND-216]|uniref:peptidylprolyl isomerase n=1 Tax=Streptomyces sp. RKND-216 TaxID=2562581 RepID=UPI00109E0205|nr:peptidylprolyl isomerase [Streptomyces sp. RKND-216]THA27330.1 peptidylprolyl isomerase [Streptomyces sp. RKND-216]
MVTSEQRRKQLAREKYLRQQERRAETRRKARIRNAAIAAGVAVVLVLCTAYALSGGLEGKEDTASDPQPSATPSAEKDAPDPCAKPAKGKPNGEQWKKEPELTVDESATYTMALDTACGKIGIEMDAGKAPHTVNSFAFLAENDFFDHTECHRLTTEGIFVLQCGDPQGSGMGGPGYTIPDENLDDERVKDGVYPAGTVAMANTGQKDSGGSQFFLVYRDSKLPPSYTPFGTVTDSGMKVLKKIAKAGVKGQAEDGRPVATATIDDATVRKS